MHSGQALGFYGGDEPHRDTIGFHTAHKLAREFFPYGFFGEGLTRMLLSHLKPEMTFIDVGAQLGYFTLLASWLVGESGHVHSFEPTPKPSIY